MTKEEKIKEAYGKHWQNVKNCICENGWVNRDVLIIDDINDFDTKSFFTINDSVRPKSLKGIETNNGWIKIESEEQYDELENGEYEWYNINNGKYDKGDLWTYGIFTHYKIVPIIKSDAPLY